MAEHMRDQPTGYNGVLRNSDLDDLAVALSREARLLDDLRDALTWQRAGVARNNADDIEDSINRMDHVLSTLVEIRARRAALMALVTGSEQTPLRQLAEVLPAPLPRALEEARNNVRQSATAVTREVAINQRVIRHALDSGELFIQQLFSTVGGPASTYLPNNGSPSAASSDAVLLNRRA